MPISESMKTFKESCDELGAFLEQFGFNYRKSKKLVVKQGPVFEYAFNFSSSRSANSVPGCVILEIFVTISSESFGDFRRSKGVNLPVNENCLIGIQLANIFKEAPPYIRYDIGDNSSRKEILNSIKNTIEKEALLIFDLVESPEDLSDFLDKNRIPAMEHFNAAQDYFDFINEKA